MFQGLYLNVDLYNGTEVLFIQYCCPFLPLSLSLLLKCIFSVHEAFKNECIWQYCKKIVTCGSRTVLLQHALKNHTCAEKFFCCLFAENRLGCCQTWLDMLLRKTTPTCALQTKNLSKDIIMFVSLRLAQLS